MAVIESGPGELELRPVKDGRWPAYQHYPGDFERDLAGNSLAAQGLWIRMLGWMHQNEAHRGFLELPNGEPLDEKQIALRIGRSLREVRPLLAELKSLGVFSVTPSGAVYCRRMARETYISEVRRAAAKSRADKATRAVDGTFAGDVAGLGAGEFAPAKTPASEEQNTVLSSSSSSSSSLTTKTCASNSDDARWDVEKSFDELWAAYPAKGRTRRPLSQQYFVDKIRTPETFARVIAAVKGKWAHSDKWAKGFIMALPQWIDQECWNEDPEPAGGIAFVGSSLQSTLDPETARRLAPQSWRSESIEDMA